MKKFFILAFCLLSTLFINAQTTVYFGNITNDVGVGIGFPKDNPFNVVISVMQVSKHKNYDNFYLRFTNAEGNDLEYHFAQDTIYHIEVDGKTYNHQCDYILPRVEFERLCKEITAQDIVYINNIEYNASAFIGVIRSLESERNKMFEYAPFDFKNARMFRAPMQEPNKDVQLMRFNPNKHNTRYIREIRDKNNVNKGK